MPPDGAKPDAGEAVLQHSALVDMVGQGLQPEDVRKATVNNALNIQASTNRIFVSALQHFLEC